MIPITDKVTNTIKQMLNYLGNRHTVISSNIANIDTPGYKSIDISFGEQLNGLLDEDSGIGITQTNSKHMGISNEDSSDTFDVVKVKTNEMRMDGNNVDMDKEMTKMAENQLLYNTLIQGINKKIGGIRYAIEEGRKG